MKSKRYLNLILWGSTICRTLESLGNDGVMLGTIIRKRAKKYPETGNP
jgi:hypothetical protein